MSPIYLVFLAVGLGVVVIAALGRRPGAERLETAEEGERRGSAAGPLFDELEASVEKKAEFLIRMGFDDLDWIADEKTQGVTAFRVRNPIPLSGGRYLVHFLKRTRDAVDSARVERFRKAVKGEDGVMKGVLVTPSAFTKEAWLASQSLPIELVDGKHLGELMKLFYPDRFPKERL